MILEIIFFTAASLGLIVGFYAIAHIVMDERRRAQMQKAGVPNIERNRHFFASPYTAIAAHWDYDQSAGGLATEAKAVENLKPIFDALDKISGTAGKIRRFSLDTADLQLTASLENGAWDIAVRRSSQSKSSRNSDGDRNA